MNLILRIIHYELSFMNYEFIFRTKIQTFAVFLFTVRLFNFFIEQYFCKFVPY
jgi:hypothetical protein